MDPKRFTRRLIALGAAMFLCALVFVVTLFDAQIVNGDDYLDKSIRTNAKTETVKASRGILTDRNGKVLVSNRAVYTLNFDSSLVSSDELNDALLRVIDLMNQLRRVGCKFSLDDFGAGGSLLNNMVDIPVNTIKLDKRFLTRCSSNARGTDFLREIVHLVKRLGYNVICEGIETPEQEAMLLEAGCCYGQGYLYARPMALADFVQFMQDHPV